MLTRKESPFEKYELLEQVGIGSFGSVFKARIKVTNETVAIKVMKKKFNSYSECTQLKEYKILKRLSYHPNIVELYETFMAPTKDFYFIMEYMNGGNLYQFINERRENNRVIETEEINTILYQILSALSHIHQVEGIFHRDMKPENLLISYHMDKLVIKLADFGLAADIKKLTRAPYTDYVSTRWYRAPEVLLKASHYSCPIDLWAVGTIFAELITLKPLFPGQSEIDQLYRICQVLGSPSISLSQPPLMPRKKSFSILQPPNFISVKTVRTTSTTPDTVGIGGPWKEGVRLAQKMGFRFPKINTPKIESLSTVLYPHTISKEGIDLLSQLLQLDPCKRITSTTALSHSFFNTNKPSIINQNHHYHHSALPSPTTTKVFDLPIIPLSPFQLGEEYSQWELLVQPVHNNNDSSLTRTTSLSYIYNDEQLYDKNRQMMMKRSVSDLSIPFNSMAIQ